MSFSMATLTVNRGKTLAYSKTSDVEKFGKLENEGKRICSKDKELSFYVEKHD